MLAEEKMSEAEVSLRLALYLVTNDMVVGDVRIAIDGAQVRTGDMVHFAIGDFLQQSGCTRPNELGTWRGTYSYRNSSTQLVIHSSPGQGDIVAHLRNGQVLRAESKKGSLVRSKSSSEYPLLREAIGQLMTIEEVGPRDLLAVAVPDSPKFRELAMRWRRAPLLLRLGIRLLTVNRNGSVFGLFEDTTRNGGGGGSVQ